MTSFQDQLSLRLPKKVCVRLIFQSHRDKSKNASPTNSTPSSPAWTPSTPAWPASPPLLKRFRQSVLAAATSGRLTEDWRISSNLDDSSTSERVAEILFKRKEMWNGRGKYTLPFAAADVSSAAFLDIPKSWIRGTLDQVAWSVKDGPHFSPE